MSRRVEPCGPKCPVCADDQAFLRRTDRPAYEKGRNPLTLVDLFCGCGGMSLGVAEAARKANRGLRPLLAVDFDAEAAAAYRRNFPSCRVETGSVEQLFDGELRSRPTQRERELVKELFARAQRLPGSGLPAVDVLIGGPPCQGHSDLNNRSRRSDPRNALYLRMIRAAEVLRPSAVIIENVPPVQHSTEGVVDQAITRFTELGYSVSGRVFDVTQLGVPQRRRRHLLLAVRKSLDAGDLLERAANRGSCGTRTVRWAIADLMGREGDRPFHTASIASRENRTRMEWFFEDPKNNYDLPNELRPPCHRDKEHSYNSVYGRLHWEKPAQTITTGFTSMGQGRYVHPARRRTLTPHEAARLQGFPDFFDFGAEAKRTVWSKLIGNAVPPRLSEVLASTVLWAWASKPTAAKEGVSRYLASP